MNHNLTDYFSKFVSLTPEETGFIRDNIPVQKMGKDAFLLKQGEVSKAFYFIIKGCVRLYYVVDGEEKTAFFYMENEFVSSYESFTRQVPASHNLQCIETCELAVISFENAHLLLKRYPKFEFLARMMMEEELMVYQDIIASFITLTPSQRYLKLCEKKPALLQRIPQYHLASFLGVRPESLSRIRKRLAK